MNKDVVTAKNTIKSPKISIYQKCDPLLILVPGYLNDNNANFFRFR